MVQGLVEGLGFGALRLWEFRVQGLEIQGLEVQGI